MISKKNLSLLLSVAFIFIFGANKVSAIDSDTYKTLFYNEKSFSTNVTSVCHSVGQKYTYVIKGHEYNIEYKSMPQEVSGNIVDRPTLLINNMEVSHDNDVLCNAWILLKWANDGDDVSFMYFKQVTGSFKVLTLYTPSILSYSDNFPYSSNSLYAGEYGVRVYRYRYNFQNGNYLSKTENEVTSCNSGGGCYDHDNRTDVYYNSVIYDWNFYVYGVNDATHLGLFYRNNRKWITSDYSSSNYILSPPSNIDFTYVPVHDNDSFGNDYIKSGSLSVNFDIFNTTDYIYEYTTNINGVWTELENNNEVLFFNDNYNVYFRVLDKNNNNNIVLTETFSISGIEKVPIVESSNFHNDDNDITYDHLIKIPISYLYNSDNNTWKNYSLVFLSKSKNDFSSDYYITTNNLESDFDIPIEIYFEENVESIRDYIERYNMSSNSSGHSGGGSSSGGGRHDYSYIGCDNLVLPYVNTIYNDTSNYYNILHLDTSCFNHNLNYYDTDYIYIYYNARLYESVESVGEDYAEYLLHENDNFDDDESKNFFSTFEKALNYFSKPIKEIFKLIKYFFNRLPVELRYMIVAVFLIGISLIIFKTLL